MDSVIAAEVAPKPTLQHTMQNLMRLPIERGNDWNVYAYAVNKDLIDKDGQIDNLRAVIFPLGSFYDEKQAEKHALDCMEKTGHPHIKISRYGCPVKITAKPDQEIVQTVTVDLKGKIIKMESDEHKAQIASYEEKIKYEKELTLECELETDVDHLEYYKRQMYLCIKHYTTYLELQKKMEEMKKLYEDKRQIIKSHLLVHPEHEEAFLPFFKEKLLGRGEEELYRRIEASYNLYKNELM